MILRLQGQSLADSSLKLPDWWNEYKHAVAGELHKKILTDQDAIAGQILHWPDLDHTSRSEQHFAWESVKKQCAELERSMSPPIVPLTRSHPEHAGDAISKHAADLIALRAHILPLASKVNKNGRPISTQWMVSFLENKYIKPLLESLVHNTVNHVKAELEKAIDSMKKNVYIPHESATKQEEQLHELQQAKHDHDRAMEVLHETQVVRAAWHEHGPPWTLENLSNRQGIPGLIRESTELFNKQLDMIIKQMILHAKRWRPNTNVASTYYRPRA